MKHIKRTKFSNDLKKYFSIKQINDKVVENDLDIFNKILDISDTIILIRNRKDIYDNELSKFDENNINENIKDIFRKYSSISLHSNLLESENQTCELGINIYIFKFENINDLNGFIESIKVEIKVDVYTTIKEDITVNINNSFNNNKDSFNESK